MLPTNNLRSRAMAYWEERLRAATRASDPEPFRRELGTIGQFFLWEVDRCLAHGSIAHHVERRFRTERCDSA